MKALPSHRLRLFRERPRGHSRSVAGRPSLGVVGFWDERFSHALGGVPSQLFQLRWNVGSALGGLIQRGGAVGTIGACSLWEHVLSDNHLGVMKGPGNGQDITLKEGGVDESSCKQIVCNC